MQKKLFTELGLSPDMLKAIDKIGFEEASPIQSEAIPVLLGGADVVGQSQTGSGKTAAFAIPAIELVDPAIRAPQILMLCPTRELAVQVAEEVSKLALFKKGVRELPIYGGQSYERQFRGLQMGAQIIIGTPGRIMDHLDRRTLKLDNIKMVVLDEADRMLDMGFVDDIKSVLSACPSERQTVLFSATLPRPIQELVRTFTKDPVNVRIEAQALTVPNIDQIYYEIDRRSKLEVLCRLIDLQDIKFGIIFCATKMMVDELTEHLVARGYSADKLHGDMSQAMRERVMTKFRKRGIEFLVATDVAARGLDVDDIEVVFNYDLPQDSEDYVHRIGRTGRAGRSGRAITFVAGREIYKLQAIIRFTKGRIRRERVPSADEVEQKRTSVFFESLREILEKGEYKRHDEMIDGLLEDGYSPTDIASALIHLSSGDKARPAAGAIPERPERPERFERDRGERRYESGKPEIRTSSFYPGKQDQAPAERPKRSRERAEEPRSLQPEEFGSGQTEVEERPAKRGKREREGDRDRDRVRGTGAEPIRERKERSAKPRRESHDEPGTRSHEHGMVRMVMNVGRDHEVSPADVVGVIAGVAKVDKSAIGAIHLRARMTLVDVAESEARHVLKKLNGIKFKGRKLSIDVPE